MSDFQTPPKRETAKHVTLKLEMSVHVKANFHSGKLSVDWNGQENSSLSCELWVGTNDFNTKKNFLVRSNPRIIFLSGN
jgi:hypothetical protein